MACSCTGMRKYGPAFLHRPLDITINKHTFVWLIWFVFISPPGQFCLQMLVDNQHIIDMNTSRNRNICNAHTVDVIVRKLHCMKSFSAFVKMSGQQQVLFLGSYIKTQQPGEKKQANMF